MSCAIKFDETENKSKGTIVEDEENQGIPEVVGLTKLQFFLFLLGAILLGAGTFGIGYTLAYFKKNQENIKKITKKIHLNDEAINETETNLEQNIPGSEFIEFDANNDKIQEQHNQEKTQSYIILGIFNLEIDAKNLQTKLTKLGKNSNIKEKNGLYVLYVGPYESFGLAQNEAEVIKKSTSLSGSVINEI